MNPFLIFAISVIASVLVTAFLMMSIFKTNTQSREELKEINERFTESGRRWQNNYKYLNDYMHAMDKCQNVTASEFYALCEHLGVEVKNENPKKRIVVSPLNKKVTQISFKDAYESYFAERKQPYSIKSFVEWCDDNKFSIIIDK